MKISELDYWFEHQGIGYCSNYVYLNDGAQDYTFITEDDENFSYCPLTECRARCEAAGHNAEGFYITPQGWCGCASDNCAAQSSSNTAYHSYRAIPISSD